MKNFFRLLTLFVFQLTYYTKPVKYKNRYYTDGSIRLPNIIAQARGGANPSTANYLASLAGQVGQTYNGPAPSGLTPQQVGTAQLLSALSQYTPVGTPNVPGTDQQGRSVVYSISNTTGGTLTYFVVGNKQIADQFNGGTSTTAVTACSDGVGGATLNNFALSGQYINLTSLVYTCGTGQGLTQFVNNLTLVSGDFDGTTKPTNIQPAIAQNPANQNVDQLKFMINWKVGQNQAFVLKVLTATQVQFAFTFTANGM